ncbi:mitogen-activated protein kinase-binding protein 1-like isoform X3 [Crassostrea angulata]|uniref:mitogen-activated protein kinase-binding protein 1-like isoform X3 n=1 Tax=Magallana angulata TaxID=2784310 RepID=UPI0022B192A1|nr:mitogen-activated protein kinase-binding protein 1-like isoform X3 [Crassostrea angulata]
MDTTRRIIRSPSLKRRSRPVPINQRKPSLREEVSLERVIGLTVSTNATLACDPNTGTIAYPAGCVVVLFNPRRNKQSHIFNTSKKTITSLAFSPDGKQLVTGETGHQPAVRVWDVAEKTQVAEFHGHKFGIVCVKFSPSLKHLVSVGSQHDMMVNVWNWKTGTKVASNKISSKVNSIAFSKDGSMFVTVGNRHVKFWYLESSKTKINETVPLQGRNGILGDHKNNYFSDVACGKAVYAITQTGLLCQFNDKRQLDKWVELRTTNATCVSAGEDNIFIGCANGVVRIFDAVNLNYVATMPRPHQLGVDVASALSPSQLISQTEDAKFPDTVAVSYNDFHKKVTCIYNDHSLYVWDVHDVRKVGKSWSFLYHSSCVWGLEVNPATTEEMNPILPSDSFMTCSSDDTIRIWNLDPHMVETESSKRNVYSNELLKVIYVDPSLTCLKDVNYNPAGGTDKTDTNYDGKNGIRSIGISPDGRHLASGDRIGNVRVHDLINMQEIMKIEAHDQEILCVQYSDLNTGPQLLASSSRDRLIHVFDVEQRYGLLQTLDDHSSSVTAIKFTENDGQIKMLSSSADKSVLFRNAQMTPTFQFVLANQHVVGNNSLYDMDIEPSQRFLATACQDRNIRIYNIKSAKQKQCYKGAVGDSGVLLKLQLDPSGQFAVTSCTDKSLALLDFKTGDLLATMFGHSELATGVKFMPDLKRLVSVSSDGCIFVWRLPPELTESMKGRLEEMGKLPMEAVNGDINRKPNNYDEALGRAPLFPNEEVIKTPTKILEELQKKREKEQPDFRYSIGPLPNWAKAKMGENSNGQQKVDNKPQPRGRWARRIDSGEDLSQLEIAESRDDQKAQKVRRETVILKQAENSPRKIPRIPGKDEDDEDFFPQIQKDGENSSDLKDLQWSRLSFHRSQDDLDDLDEESQEVIYYPPSEASVDTNSSSFTVFSGQGLRKLPRGSSRSSLSERPPDAESSSTDPVSVEELDDEEDPGDIPSLPTTPGDELGKTPDREKFLKDTFENLSFTPESKERFKKSLDEEERKQEEAEEAGGFNPRQSISTKFLSRSQQANIKNIAQKQDNWFDSLQRRRDVMARAVDETRKTLMAMGWKDQSPESEADPRHSPVQEVPEVRRSLEREDIPNSPRTPTSLRRCWSTFDLPKQPIQEEHPVTVPFTAHTPSTKGNSRTVDSSSSSPPRWRSRIPTPQSLSRSTPQSGNALTSDSDDSSSGGRPTRRSRPSTLSVSREERKKLEPRSHSHSSSYRKQTSSSQARLSTERRELGNGLSKSTSMTNLNNNGGKKQSTKTRTGKPLSKSAAYASTPNLLSALSDTSEDLELDNTIVSGNLSNSVPDLLDEDPQKVKSKRGEAAKLLPETKRFSTGTPKRVNSASELGKKPARMSLPGRQILSDKSDKELMPPPPTTNISVTKSKQSVFIKRATRSQTRSKQELTLDQAKNILKGNSGILPQKQGSSPPVSENVRSTPPSGKSIPKVTSPPVHLTSNILEIATEIEMTADELRRQKIESAFQNLSALDASPNDLPEKDYTPQNHNSSITSLTSVSTLSNNQLSPPDYLANSLPAHNDTPLNDSWNSTLTSHSDNELDNTPSKSIKERIAQLTSRSSPQPAVTSSPSSLAMYSPGSNASQYSSGVGSSLDSETATRMFQGISPPTNSHRSQENSYTLEHALNVVSQSSSTYLTTATETIPTIRQTPAHSPHPSNRSISLSSSHSTVTPSPTQSPRTTNDITLSMEAIKDLKKAVSVVTDTYKKLQEHSNGAQSEGLQMLTDAIQECSSEMASLLPDKFSTNHYTEIKDLIRQNQQILTTNQQMLKSLMVPK